MKQRLLFIVLMVLIVSLLTACKSTDENTDTNDTLVVGVVIDDVVLIKGESTTIYPQLTPAGTFGVVTFEIVSSTPASVISIVGTTISALEVGTATVKATATNMQGASQTFSAEKTFTVTVNAIPVVAGEYVLNGGFEFGLNEWTVTSPFGQDAYGTTVVDNYPHGGDAALNLWYDDDLDELSEPVDLKLSQTTSSLAAGTYLFQLWYQGTMDSIQLSVFSGTTLIEAQTFSGFDYQAPEGHHGYVNYGIEFEITATTPVTFEIHVLGAAESWGYIDDVSLKLGTLDDLVIVPPSGEAGYVNFIDGGQFTSLNAWTIDISGPASNKQANLSSGRLSIWADGAATYRIYQNIELIEETYHMVIYINGGALGTEFNVDDAYIYVKNDTETHKIDLTPEGWNQGVMKRIELSDLSLSGSYEVGIYINFTGGSNNWINLDDFALWSYNIALDPADVLAAAAVDALIDTLPALDQLTTDDAELIVSIATAFNALTPLQKSFVTKLNLYTQAVQKLELLLADDALALFNAEGEFESDSTWTMASVGWTVTSGNQWTTDWGYESEKSYNPFKDQAGSLLVGRIEKPLALEAGDYVFSMYMAGSDVSVTITIGGVSNYFIVTSGSYTLYTFDFTLAAASEDIVIEMNRLENGWLHIDNVRVDVDGSSS